jgi:uncharacterized membrane protein YedE/YeeE
MRLASAFLTGLIFGVGILISGMADPAKVLNFFDIAGDWDPSLIFVMAGGLAVTAPGYALLRRLAGRPMFETRFQFPTLKTIDAPLVLGSAVFGMGWGIAGFCPGGAIPALGTGNANAAIFVLSMIAGLLLARGLRARRPRSQAA